MMQKSLKVIAISMLFYSKNYQPLQRERRPHPFREPRAQASGQSASADHETIGKNRVKSCARGSGINFRDRMKAASSKQEPLPISTTSPGSMARSMNKSGV